MSAPSASNGAMTPSARAEPDTRLHGRWLLLARVAWVGVVALIVGVFITSLPVFLVQLQVTCAPATCSFWQLTPAAAQTLQSLGFSPGAYAIYTLTLVIVFGLVWLVSALVIFWRKSDDWMALLFALMFVLLGTAEVTEVVEASHSAWQLPAIFLNELAYGLLFLVFSLFPNGRFVPRWMRWLLLGYLPYSVLHGSLFFSNSLVHLGRYPVLFNLLFFFFLACLVGAQVYRYRRVSTAVQRQQTKWVVFATAVTILVGLGLIGPALLLPSLSPPYILLAETVSTLFAPIIPISVGMAILRYRLWEIDTIINKALVYSTLTATLAVIYAGLVIGLQTLLRGIIGQDNSVAIVISTLAIAALFQPLRHRLQKLIDRRFYRSKYDAAKIIEAFSATLRNEVDLQQLSEHLVTVVEETMQPTFVSLWLRPTQQDGKRTPWRANPPVPLE
jgi:hypothetical protein